MKAKKPLLLIVLTLVLLAVALLLPAAAFGKPAHNPPVSWVKESTSSWGPNDFFPNLLDHGTTAACITKVGDTVKGQLIVSMLREFWPGEDGITPTLFRYTVKTSTFTSPDWWDVPMPDGWPGNLSHVNFFFAGENNWPEDLGGPTAAPSWWASYKGAAVADIVAYVPISQYPASLPWPHYYPPGTPTIPYRFMFIDSCKHGKGDRIMSWLIGASGWWDQTVDEVIQSGHIEVHVGK